MKNIIFFLLLSYSLVFSQTEVIINSFRDSTQNQPAINVIDSADNFAVVWKSFGQVDENSEGDILLRFFASDLNPESEEFLVSDNSDGPQETPAVSSDRNGSLIVVWSSFNRNVQDNFFDIKAKLYNNMAAATFEFTVNTSTINSQIRPSVDMRGNGEFIVVWESWFQDGSDRGVYAQLFDNTGNKIGDEFLVNSSTQFSQCRPVVKYFEDGKFIIAWESWDESEMGYNIYGKIFDESGNTIKDEFMINSYTDNYQWMTDIATYADNSFDVVWCSWEQDGYDGGIYLRTFNGDFEAAGEEILINSSTEYYQWLPKIGAYPDGNKTIIWSSWNQDGSREGVYFKSLTKANKTISLEKRVNDNTESYQWEPDLAILSNGDLVSTWSSWGEVDKDYEIMMKKIKPEFLIGKLNEESYNHYSGNSTSEFVVHVVDSAMLNGHTYELSFEQYDQDFLSFSIDDITASENKISQFPLNQGDNVQYLTEKFDGIIVEVIPNFELDIDLENSTFINKSGTNINFRLEKPVIYPTIAPLDIAVIWGNPDTLTDGTFSEPSDTGLTTSNIREIELPFYAVTIEENEKLSAVIFEDPSTQNKRWDPGEDVVFLTPEAYKTNDFSTHVQLFSTVDESEIIWPNIGDTNYILTIKPITADDVYQFSTYSGDIILDLNNVKIPNQIRLSQNYPNPFNPSTRIEYSIPEKTMGMHEGQSITAAETYVTLTVYDILGREVAVLVNGIQRPGRYSIEFNASDISSGVYFYRLNVGNMQIIKKMILLR